jgi:hypothetical protein
MRKEDKLAQQVATYLKLQYPDTIYHFDVGSGGSTSIGMAMRNKRLNKWQGYPDLFIAERKSIYGGLFIEIKVDSVLKKDGGYKKSDHLLKQRVILNQLRSAGYYTAFGCGFDNIKKIIDEYMAL